VGECKERVRREQSRGRKEKEGRRREREEEGGKASKEGYGEDRAQEWAFLCTTRSGIRHTLN
jgi:hypothetical protein